MSVLLILVTSSQPCLIFSIFFLRHGRNSMALQNRTIIGRKTAIIKVGGVYHTNCFISTHLFQAKINACIVPSRRETIPSLLCKRKKNDLGGSTGVYSTLPHLFCCLESPSFICNHFPIIFLNNAHSHISILLTNPHLTPLLWVMFCPQFIPFQSQLINNTVFFSSTLCSSVFVYFMVLCLLSICLNSAYQETSKIRDLYSSQISCQIHTRIHVF